MFCFFISSDLFFTFLCSLHLRYSSLSSSTWYTLIFYFIFQCYFIATSGSIRDLKSLIRDGTWTPCQWKCGVLTTGPQGKSQYTSTFIFRVSSSFFLQASSPALPHQAWNTALTGLPHPILTRPCVLSRSVVSDSFRPHGL